MKIICDSCGAKYSIADEKVQGKVFKIRCKKCSEVIVVKGTDDGGEGDFGSAYGNGAGAAEWYVVIDGERDGPISPEEIEAYYTIGKLGPETFVWRDGLEDWVMLNTLSEFAHLTADSAGPEEATMIAARPEAASGFAGGGAGAGMALGGGGSDIEDSTMVMDSGRFEADAFSEPAPDDYGSGSHAAVESGSYSAMGGGGASVNGNNGADLGGGYDGGSFDSFDDGGYDDGGYDDGGYDDGDQGGMFAAFDSGAADDSYDGGGIDFSASSSGPSLQASSPSGGEANDLVGARNDNSVLFSLSSVDQVKAVSKPSEGQAQGNDKSGLIDIQALASTHAALKGGGGDADDDADFVAGTMSVPAMMPMGSHKKSNNGLLIGIGIGGGAVVIGLIVLVGILLTRDDTPQQQQVIVAEQPAEEEEEEGLSEEEAAEAEAAAEAARAALEAAEEEEEEEEEEAQEVASASASPQRSGSTGSSSPPRQQQQAAPTPTRQTGGGGGGGGDILDRIGGGGGGGGSTAPQQQQQQQQQAASSLPDSLSRSMVQNTIRRYNAQVRSCSQNNPEGLSGNASIRFVVQGNGSVSSASAQGEFSGSTVGSCLEGVVRGMRFPETQDSNRTITYPFPVR